MPDQARSRRPGRHQRAGCRPPTASSVLSTPASMNWTGGLWRRGRAPVTPAFPVDSKDGGLAVHKAVVGALEGELPAVDDRHEHAGGAHVLARRDRARVQRRGDARLGPEHQARAGHLDVKHVVGSDMPSDLVGWGRFELPTSSSRTGLQPCYQVFCGLKATGWCGVEPISGLPWQQNGGSPRGDSHAIRNNRWNLLSDAVDGPLAGSRLEAVPHLDTFWFAWATFVPDTEILP